MKDFEMALRKLYSKYLSNQDLDITEWMFDKYKIYTKDMDSFQKIKALEILSDFIDKIL